MNNSLSRIYRNGDRIMLIVIWLLFALALALAPLYDTWSLAFTVGLGIAIGSSAAFYMAGTSRFTRAINALAFMMFSALIIHQTHGMIEMHFAIFVLLAFLLFYRDWFPLVLGAVVIALHHLVFYLLQTQGTPIYVFNHSAGISMVLVHAAFVVAEVGLLVYMAALGKQEVLDADEVML